MQSLLGKMLRLDVRRPGSAPEIVALGLRNPWRYSFDRLTGDLYIGDVGQGDVEEVDYTPRSSAGLENYGWDVYEGSQPLRGEGAGPGELVYPIYEYSHDRGCTVVGGYVYRGHGATGRARPVHVRRLLLGDDLEPARERAARRSACESSRSGSRASPRSARTLRASCSRRHTRASCTGSASAAANARRRLPERRVGERVQRLLQVVELARDER